MASMAPAIVPGCGQQCRAPGFCTDPIFSSRIHLPLASLASISRSGYILVSTQRIKMVALML